MPKEILIYQNRRVENEQKTASEMFRETTWLLERERQRLAFDLHDGPAQALSSAMLQADMLDDMVESKEAKKELESLKAILNQCLKELRSSIYSLKPQSLSKNGLLASISGYLKHFSLRTGIVVELITRCKENNLPEDIQVNVFRIIQEALNNVHKHSKADRAIVHIEFGRSKISCSVEDNGIGFEVYDCRNGSQGLGSYGLMIMTDRAKQLQGSFKIESELGKGTSVKFSIPI